MRKLITQPAFFYCLLIIILTSCESRNLHVKSQNVAHQYATSTEATEQGKRDLIKLAQQCQTMDLNLKASQIEQSHTNEVIDLVELDIEELFSNDSIKSLNDIVFNKKERITPLYVDDKLLTSIVTRVDSGIWTVSGIRNQMVEQDIDELRKSMVRFNESPISLFEVPFLNAYIYCISNEGTEVYYTRYHGHSFQRQIDLNSFISLLRNELTFMQKAYGSNSENTELVR